MKVEMSWVILGEMAWVAVALFVLFSLSIWNNSGQTSVKDHIISIFSSVGHMISVTTT